MRLFPGDPAPQHFVSPSTDLDIKLLLKCLGLTVKESDKGERSQTQDSFALVLRWEIQPRETLEVSQEALKYGPRILKAQIYQDGFIGKGFPSASQPQQWRCLTVTLLCLRLRASGNFLSISWCSKFST